MENLTQEELLNIKKLIQTYEISYQKLNMYAIQVIDPQIKQLFTKAAQDTINTKQKLMSFLTN